MHRFPHGIRQAFLRPVWAPLRRCLPLLALLQSCPEDGDDDELLTNKAQHDGVSLPTKEDRQEKGGCLLPTSGEDGALLPPAQSGEEGGSQQPTQSEGKEETEDDDQQENGALAEGDNEDHPTIDEGNLLPLRGDEDQQVNGTLAEAEPDLHAHLVGHKEENKGAKSLLEDGDQLLPQSDDAEYNADLLPKQEHEGGLLSTLGCHNCGDIFGMHVSDFDNSLKIYDITNMHATIEMPSNLCMVHDDVVIVHAKPRVDPKVKKKTSLLLCLTIHTPFHPGEHGHDGNPSSRHHEPCSSPWHCLYIECSCPSVHPSPQLPSTTKFFILASFSNEDKDAAQVLQATVSSIHFPFTPLRGRKGFQGREWHDEEKTKTKINTKLKTKLNPTMIKMRLHYLNKDLLDPG